MVRAQIRLLTRLEEFGQCERLQRTVWGNVGVSGELLAVTQKYGGVVLGAVVGGKVVGCLYAFLARRHEALIHWSHIMAVEPAYRDQGLGFRMKLAHRQLALARGIKSICWTYDPLQSRNAALNIARLGARVEEYIPNCYGRFPSAIEKGLPSDRFVVNWRIASLAVARRLREGIRSHRFRLASLPRANETRLNARGFAENTRIYLRLRARRVLVEIPANTEAMRSRDLKLAWRWRIAARKIFRQYFAAGYYVEDFLPPSSASSGKCFYLLRR
jgi:predicted GNAT superfamily acetyltransferase